MMIMARLSVLGLSVALMVLGPAAGSAVAQERYASPEAASKALVDAARAAEPGFVDRIFGQGARDLFSSGDPDEDKARLGRFNEAAAEGVTLVPRGDDVRILQIGRRAFAFPIPVARKGDAWVFDIAAGRDEILNRRIGENELHAIEACEAYVAAQREYVRTDHDGDGVFEYAQRIISSPGQRDGLYWSRSSQSDVSPLEGRITDAMLENRADRVYHGYRFRILRGQGNSAPGGAHSYVINGNMIAGFALLAWPAQWGRTGVMSFICNQSGVVLQKNLGPRTGKVVNEIRRFDPDRSWVRVE
jgi:hypothetical protein